MEEKNYYELIGLPPDASNEEIDKAILKKIRIWQKRTNTPTLARRQEAERMIERLDEIKLILLDPEQRAKYDQKLQEIKRK
ncbi:DnaJ domain-containing protein [Thermoflavimicrobium daqui]|nr:DnaJ domain-containing protein [Thermoflavimicrobium daqui]